MEPEKKRNDEEQSVTKVGQTDFVFVFAYRFWFLALSIVENIFAGPNEREIWRKRTLSSSFNLFVKFRKASES